MLPTMPRLRKKLTPLSEGLQNLRVNGTRNFFEFYVLNKNVVDYIVETNINKYGGKLDGNDLHQDILMRLQRINVLKRYNPGKSSLHTYLTNCVRGYIRTAHQQTIQQNHWEPWPTQKKKYGPKGPSKNTLEILPYQDAFKAGHLLLTENRADEELFAKEVVEILQNKLAMTPSKRGKNLHSKILKLLADDRKKIEIAKLLGCSPVWVGNVAEKLAVLCTRLLNNASAAHTAKNF